MKKIITILLMFTTLMSVTVPTLAVSDINTELESFKGFDNRVSLISSDSKGNEKVLYSYDSEDLKNSISFFSNPALPHPAKYANGNSGIDSFSNRMAARNFPENCNFLLLDLGSNWSVEDSDSHFQSAHGRYVYIFYGEYVAEYDGVVTGHYGVDPGYYPSDSHYTDIEEYGNPDTYTLTIRGPFLVLNYNEQTNNITILENTYDDLIGEQFTLSMTGITIDGDEQNPDYYARILTWAHYDNQNAFMFSSDLALTTYYTELNWLSEDNSPNISGGSPDGEGLWIDSLTNSGIIDPDSTAGQLIINVIEGIGDFIDFVSSIPEFFDIILSVFPEPMAEFLKSCIKVVMIAFILKIGLAILR